MNSHLFLYFVSRETLKKKLKTTIFIVYICEDFFSIFKKSIFLEIFPGKRYIFGENSNKKVICENQKLFP